MKSYDFVRNQAAIFRDKRGYRQCMERAAVVIAKGRRRPIFMCSIEPGRLAVLGAMRFAALVNRFNPSLGVATTEMNAAASAFGRPIGILVARTNREIDTAFANLRKSAPTRSSF